MCNLPKSNDDNLIVGLETSDDAAVYKINDDLALIETLDFFTPIVDNPTDFGRIAAANSLSDVYAMGGDPKVAMNIVCFPNCLDPSILGEILKGGFDKVNEAGCTLVGGHTVQDDEPKYGLSVTGFVNPSKVWTNSNLKPGDSLVLTKPIGTGVITTAIKGGIVDYEMQSSVIEIMATLNKYAKIEAEAFNINSCTDITGFGLGGHIYEMASGSNCTVDLFFNDIPIIDGVKEFFNFGLIPEGTYNNKEFVGDNIKYLINDDFSDIIFDPQTSGGLLFSLPEKEAVKLNNQLNSKGISSNIIGSVKLFDEKYIFLK